MTNKINKLIINKLNSKCYIFNKLFVYINFNFQFYRMNEDLLSRIESSGFKKKHIAEKLGITQTYLSMCISGTRVLSRKKEKKLSDLLSFKAA